jgi:GMC oxidoreductase/HI0933-like protein
MISTTFSTTHRNARTETVGPVKVTSFRLLQGGNFDLCVVGAGPTGLMVALTASSLGKKVLILERGSSAPTAVSFDASIRATSPYPDPASTRASAVGGSSWRWRLLRPKGAFGARLAFEPAVFDRSCSSIPGWPFGVDELREPVQEVLNALSTGLVVDNLMPNVESDVEVQISHFGFCGSSDVQGLATTLHSRSNVVFVTSAEVVSLRMTNDVVESVLVRQTGSDDAPIPVSAANFILAGSTIETCRLLAALQTANPTFSPLEGLGVGISDHPRLRGSGELTPDLIRLVDASVGSNPVRQLRIEPTSELLQQGVPSASVCFVPDVSTGRAQRVWDKVLFGTAKVDNYASGHAPDRVSRLIAQQLQSTLPALTRLGHSRQGIGYSTDRIPHQGSFKTGKAIALVMAEQLPDARNKINFHFAGGGLPGAELVFGAPFDPQFVLKTLEHLSAGMNRRGWSKQVNWERLPTAYSSHHLSGGAAISGPYAVADDRGVVFGTTNLVVTGLASLPSSGHANPTLLAMALSSRSVRKLLT